ncbi:WD repeat-containing protein, putative [Hepatocystis sp. ex Piliocolobus tephrosceles]|nr:WD repeat-containing protein, putative [Hepatocystis sp. ex Piliocolobus tephrosceles]
MEQTLNSDKKIKYNMSKIYFNKSHKNNESFKGEQIEILLDNKKITPKPIYLNFIDTETKKSLDKIDYLLQHFDNKNKIANQKKESLLLNENDKSGIVEPNVNEKKDEMIVLQNQKNNDVILNKKLQQVYKQKHKLNDINLTACSKHFQYEENILKLYDKILLSETETIIVFNIPNLLNDVEKEKEIIEKANERYEKLLKNDESNYVNKSMQTLNIFKKNKDVYVSTINKQDKSSQTNLYKLHKLILRNALNKSEVLHKEFLKYRNKKFKSIIEEYKESLDVKEHMVLKKNMWVQVTDKSSAEKQSSVINKSYFKSKKTNSIYSNWLSSRNISRTLSNKSRTFRSRSKMKSTKSLKFLTNSLSDDEYLVRSIIKKKRKQTDENELLQNVVEEENEEENVLPWKINNKKKNINTLTFILLLRDIEKYIAQNIYYYEQLIYKNIYLNYIKEKKIDMCNKIKIFDGENYDPLTNNSISYKKKKIIIKIKIQKNFKKLINFNKINKVLYKLNDIEKNESKVMDAQKNMEKLDYTAMTNLIKKNLITLTKKKKKKITKYIRAKEFKNKIRKEIKKKLIYNKNKLDKQTDVDGTTGIPDTMKNDYIIGKDPMGVDVGQTSGNTYQSNSNTINKGNTLFDIIIEEKSKEEKIKKISSLIIDDVFNKINNNKSRKSSRNSSNSSSNSSSSNNNTISTGTGTGTETHASTNLNYVNTNKSNNNMNNTTKAKKAFTLINENSEKSKISHFLKKKASFTSVNGSIIKLKKKTKENDGGDNYLYTYDSNINIDGLHYKDNLENVINDEQREDKKTRYLYNHKIKQYLKNISINKLFLFYYKKLEKNVTSIDTNYFYDDYITASYSNTLDIGTYQNSKGNIAVFSFINPTYPLLLYNLDSSVMKIKYSNNNPNILVAALANGHIYIYDIRTGTNTNTISYSNNNGNTASTTATATATTNTGMYPLLTSETIEKYFENSFEPIYDFTFKNNNNYANNEIELIFYTAHENGHVYQWNIKKELTNKHILYIKNKKNKLYQDLSFIFENKNFIYTKFNSSLSCIDIDTYIRHDKNFIISNINNNKISKNLNEQIDKYKDIDNNNVTNNTNDINIQSSLHLKNKTDTSLDNEEAKKDGEVNDTKTDKKYIKSISKEQELLNHYTNVTENITEKKIKPIHSYYYLGTRNGIIYRCNSCYEKSYLNCYYAHFGAVNKIKINPFDHDIFLSAGEDSTTKLWNKFYNNQITTFKSKNSFTSINDILWLPNNSTSFFSCADDGRVELWDFDFISKDPLVIFYPNVAESSKMLSLKMFNKNDILLCGDSSANVSMLKIKNLVNPGLDEYEQKEKLTNCLKYLDAYDYF